MKVDKALCISYGGLLTVGMVASVTSAGCSWPRHLLWVVLGVAVFIAASLLDYHVLKGYAMALYGLLIGGLVLVLLVASFTRGTRAWFNFGFFKVQPSELGKPVFLVALAYLVSELRGEISKEDLKRLLLFAGVPMFLVLIEPDLGQTLVYAVILLGALLLGGLRTKYLVAIAAAGTIAAVVALSSPIVADYQRQRLTVFATQDSASITRDPAAYNLAQSKIAIGSGGWFGKGFGRATQTRLAFVPEQCTDFIFTAVGEQFGFVGACLVLVLYALLVWRLLRIASVSRELFGMLIAAGTAVMIIFHVFQNAGMTMGIMPITGIPLPLLSYGGSSMLATSAAIGVSHSVWLRRFS
jgi:rod shape determining protein RodA